MAADGVVADRTIDAMIYYLAGKQYKEGNWHNPPFGNRAPMEDSDFTRTAMAVRSLRAYGPTTRKADSIDESSAAPHGCTRLTLQALRSATCSCSGFFGLARMFAGCRTL